MSDYDMHVGDLVTDRIFRPQRVGIIIAIDFAGSIKSIYMVHWIGFSKTIPYRDWEIKKIQTGQKMSYPYTPEQDILITDNKKGE